VRKLRLQKKKGCGCVVRTFSKQQSGSQLWFRNRDTVALLAGRR